MSCTKILEAVPIVITCSGPTTHYSSGCALLKAYDHDNDGVLDSTDSSKAIADYNAGLLTAEESTFVVRAYALAPNKLINETCSGCFTPPALPTVIFHSHRFETPTAPTSRIFATITISNAPIGGMTVHYIVDGVTNFDVGLGNGSWEVNVGGLWATNQQHSVTVVEANPC